MIRELQTDRVTEIRNPTTYDIDRLDVIEVLKLINGEDARITAAVSECLPAVARAVGLIVSGMKAGGRLIYVGAGTSGRLGVLDAVECSPTFGVSSAKVVGILAGGKRAMFKAKEGVEDDYDLGGREINRIKVRKQDSVIGIAASGRTPFILGALTEAKKKGATCIGLFCVAETAEQTELDVVITPVVGPEILTGSTRMKAGTAQKMVLNMISTTVMIQLGKVYSNLMVDLKPTNQKLVERSQRIFKTITGADDATARQYLDQAGYNVKAGIVMYKRGCSFGEAIRLLKKNEGFLKRIIG